MPLFYLLHQRSTEQMRKVPTIVLSITYKGVKFIDAANKVGLDTHIEENNFFPVTIYMSHQKWMCMKV